MTGSGAGRLQRKLSRYTAVSVSAAFANALLYTSLLSTTSLHPVMANVASATVVVIPTYLAHRRWVWRVGERAGTVSKGVIYWCFSMVNVSISSSLAWALAQRNASNLSLVAATAGVYTGTWVLRFLFLDRLLFRASTVRRRPDRPRSSVSHRPDQPVARHSPGSADAQIHSELDRPGSGRPDRER